MIVPKSLPLSSTHQIQIQIQHPFFSYSTLPNFNLNKLQSLSSSFNTNKLKLSIKCSTNPDNKTLQTCKNCKTQFDPALNHPLSCRFHTSHFGGETKRKFESVYTGGTMNTPDSGQVFQYWHCCGSEDPFDPGCTSSPHMSYDD